MHPILFKIKASKFDKVLIMSEFSNLFVLSCINL